MRAEEEPFFDNFPFMNSYESPLFKFLKPKKLIRNSRVVDSPENKKNVDQGRTQKLLRFRS